VFWFVAIVAAPLALAGVFLIPPQVAETTDSLKPTAAKWKSLDLVGVSILTSMNFQHTPLHGSRVLIVAIILFIFAVTSSSTDGWASAMVLAPLILSILMMVAFFYWETLIPVENAAMYVISNVRNYWLILHQTTSDMVLQQLQRSGRCRTAAILLVVRGGHDFQHPVARYTSVVGNIVGHTHVGSSLLFHVAYHEEYFAC